MTPVTDRPHGLGLSVTVNGGPVNIGGEIRVWVVEARGGHARLIIDAPRHLTIIRERPMEGDDVGQHPHHP